MNEILDSSQFAFQVMLWKMFHLHTYALYITFPSVSSFPLISPLTLISPFHVLAMVSHSFWLTLGHIKGELPESTTSSKIEAHVTFRPSPCCMFVTVIMDPFLDILPLYSSMHAVHSFCILLFLHSASLNSFCTATSLLLPILSHCCFFGLF